MCQGNDCQGNKATDMSEENSTESFQAKAPAKRPSKLPEIIVAWQKLPEAEQKAWWPLISREKILKEIQERIREDLHISDVRPGEASGFRRFLGQEKYARQRARALKRLQRRMLKIRRDWSLDRAREEVIRWSYEFNTETEDFQTVLKTVNAHCRTESVQLNQRRFEDSRRADEEKALAVCLEEAKKFPEIQALFREAFAALKKAQDAE